MFTNSNRKPKRVLEPIDRISEFLFGLVMVLTLTCTFNASGANRNSVRIMLFEALGCNVARGIIDAFFYLLSCLAQRGSDIAFLSKIRRTSDPNEATQIAFGKGHTILVRSGLRTIRHVRDRIRIHVFVSFLKANVKLAGDVAGTTCTLF